MTRLSCVVILLGAAALCQAQPVTLLDARKEIGAAREKVTEVVTFCARCERTGTLEGKQCPYCEGHGAILKCEADLIEHRILLEDRATRAGAPAERYAEFDVGQRLPAFEKKIEPQALEMLAAYVGYLKAYNTHKEIVNKEDKEAAERIEQELKLLDGLIDRHGPRLFVQSLRMLYADDPVGKVGAFSLQGEKTALRVEGEDVEQLSLRTLKDYSVLIRKGEARKRKGDFIVAEIVGKGTYETDSGQSLKAIILQPW